MLSLLYYLKESPIFNIDDGKNEGKDVILLLEAQA